ncbi:MAG: hypothetical protein EBS74_00370 [Flavobacteriia bacterium]|nr:hypothetical protein [Flavobacteriia bacterium]
MKNKDLLDIAAVYGNPIYVYDSAKIAEQYQRLSAAFQTVGKLRINYAAKALSNISVLKLMLQLGSGLDTVSIQEVRLGLAAGFEQGANICAEGKKGLHGRRRKRPV